MMGEEASAFVKYETFEPKMLELLAGGEFEPDSDETLLQCFRAFDEEGRGYVEATKLREALITKGTPFREKGDRGLHGGGQGRRNRSDLLRGLCCSLERGE